MIIAIPVTADDLVAHGWGRAPRVAVAAAADGVISSWRVHDVGWDTAHDEGTEGAHHARVVRFLTGNEVEAVSAEHMGDPMLRMLDTMGIAVVLGATGDARTAVLTALQTLTPTPRNH